MKYNQFNIDHNLGYRGLTANKEFSWTNQNLGKSSKITSKGFNFQVGSQVHQIIKNRIDLNPFSQSFPVMVLIIE